MAELVGKNKVYPEFFTNLAVAWFAAGVISPLFTIPEDLTKMLSSIFFGTVSALVCLKEAEIFSQGGGR